MGIFAITWSGKQKHFPQKKFSNGKKHLRIIKRGWASKGNLPFDVLVKILTIWSNCGQT